MVDPGYIHSQNISYYDHVARQYNDTLNKESSNTIIRAKVAQKFREVIPKNSLVLDFGGGTGFDLNWLTEYNKVIFCEPSIAMREVALLNNHQNSSIIFLDSSKTDFHTWCHNLPFQEKLDGVLCNFAVLNSIPDLPFLFEVLSVVMKPGASLFALMLDNSLQKLIKHSKRKTVMSVIFNLPFTFHIYSDTYKQTVYIHTDRTIKNAAGKFLELIYKETWKEYGFCLIHLAKK